MIALRRGVGSDSRNVQTDRPVRCADVRPAQPEDDVGDERGEREERRDQEQPERLRVGQDRDLDRQQPRRDQQRQGGDDDDEQPEGREEPSAEQRDEGRPDDAVDDDEDARPRRSRRGVAATGWMIGAAPWPNGNGWVISIRLRTKTIATAISPSMTAWTRKRRTLSLRRPDADRVAPRSVSRARAGQ